MASCDAEGKATPVSRHALVSANPASAAPGVLNQQDTTVLHIKVVLTEANAAAWSPDGGTLYNLSNRDGGVCVWRQRLDHNTGHPVGAAEGVWHFHEARRAMSRIPLATRGLAVSRDRVVVSVSGAAGNIWLAGHSR